MAASNDTDRLPDTDRNLLFGVLCLQADVIDAARFAEICTAWTARKEVSLADLLAERGWLTAEERAHIEFLLARKLQKHGGDAQVVLAACADEAARQVLATLDDVAVRRSLDGLLPPAGDVLLSTVAHQPQTRERYTLTQLYAQGGIGQVWLAHDRDLGRAVALKELRPERQGHPVVLGRFLDEARITGQLEHPGIVPVYELARGSPDGQPFYTMRFVKGRTLRQAIADYHAKRQDGRAGPLDLIGLSTAFVTVCNAIAYAHSRGVLHRDLKPHNVVLGDFGEVLVLDWGLARLVDRPEADRDLPPVGLEPDSHHEATVQGQVLGTPAYMAPEQASGRLDLIDRRTDIYGLGAILYEILVGRPPFQDADTRALLERVLVQDPQPPRQVAGGVPAALEAVCLKAMAKKREQRYASAGELAEEVRRWLADEPVTAWREPWLGRLGRWGRRHKALVAGAAALLVAAVLALAAGTILLGREQQRTEEARALADANFHEAADRAEALERQLYVNRVNLAYRECLLNNVRLAERLLDDCPETRRGWEWRYCRRLCHLEALTIAPDAKQHGAFINMAFGPGGTIAAAHTDGTITLWDAATGKEGRTIHAHLGAAFGVAISPDGRHLASGGALGEVKLWETASGQLIRSLRGPAGLPTCLRFSSDGLRLAAGSATAIKAKVRPGVKVWQVATGEELGTVTENHWGQANVVFSPDGQQFATVNEWTTTLSLWDAATGREIRQVNVQAGAGNYGVAWAPDGHHIALGCRDGGVLLWDVVTNTLIHNLRGHTGSAHDVAFSPDGRLLASAGADGALKLWDPTTGRAIATYRGHRERVFRVGFSPDGAARLASLAADHTIKLWDLADEAEVLTLTGNRGWAFRAAFSHDGSRLITAGFNVVRIRDVASGQMVMSFLRPGDGVQGLALSPDGSQVASSGEFAQTLELHEAATGRLLRTFKGHSGQLRAVAFAPDGAHLASASEDGTVRLWDAATAQEVRVLRGHPRGVFGVTYSPDGATLASIGWNDTVRLWDPATGQEIRALVGAGQRAPSGFGNALAFNPDGLRLAAPGENDTLVVWDVASGRVVLTLRGHTGPVNGIAFSRDGRRIVSAAEDQTLKLWDATTGDEVFTLRGHRDGVLGVAFSPDGLRIASASKDMTVKLWEAVTPGAESTRRRRAAAQAEPLNHESWQVVREPNRPAPDYERALRQAEQACQGEPKEGNFRNTLGVAQYRNGQYREALESLKASDQANQADHQGSMPADLAFLAMAHHRLGHRAEAANCLERLQKAMKTPRWRADQESIGFLHEAEALLAAPEPGSSKR